MNFLFANAFSFGALISCSTAQSQIVAEYFVGDTNVVSQVSPDSPLDTSWVFSSIYDERVVLPNPGMIVIRRARSLDPPLTQYFLNGDTIATSEYYSNGQLKAYNVSLRFGAWLHTEEYHPNGQLHFQMNPNSDSLQHGLVFYPSGKKEREFWWNGGRTFNRFTEWYEDGQVKLEARYEEWPLTESDYRMTLPVGDWKYYKLNGDIEKIEVYEEGKLKETRTK